MKKGRIIGLLLVALLACGSSVNASIIVDDWTLNLSGIDGIGTEVVSGIGQITFLGMTHNQIVVDGGAPGPSAGDQSVVDGLLAATSFANTAGEVIFGTGLNSIYQLTFEFHVDGLATGFDGVNQNFTHLAPTNASGLLTIYVDGPTGGVTAAQNSTGKNFLDGVPIATFSILAGDGGVFNLSTWDGSDDATFELISALPGVILDADGNDLSLLGKNLITYTDSNYDANPQNISPDGFNIGGPGKTYPNIADAGNWPFAFKDYGTYYGWFAEEDGSARLAVVPEPSTFILLGAGLLGLGVIGRRRVRK